MKQNYQKNIKNNLIKKLDSIYENIILKIKNIEQNGIERWTLIELPILHNEDYNNSRLYLLNKIKNTIPYKCKLYGCYLVIWFYGNDPYPNLIEEWCTKFRIIKYKIYKYVVKNQRYRLGILR